MEYLTLSVGNAKSHPVSAGGRHETAIAFLTDLEEKLEVAQVQLEMHAALYPRINEPGEVGAKIQLLSKTLLTITEVGIHDACLACCQVAHGDLASLVVSSLRRAIRPPHHEASYLPCFWTPR